MKIKFQCVDDYTDCSMVSLETEFGDIDFGIVSEVDPDELKNGLQGKIHEFIHAIAKGLKLQGYSITDMTAPAINDRSQS